MKKVFFVFMILFLVIPSKGQYFVSGKVVNSENQPLEFVNVVLSQLPDSVLISGTVSDRFGNYQVEVRTIGKYFLEVSMIGYKKQSRLIEVKANGGNMPDSIVLEKEIIRLDGVSVTATPSQFMIRNGVLTVKIKGSILEEEHVMDDLLAKIPGVIRDRGKIKVFGNGEPVFYINNRKVSTIDEVASLDIKSIQKIEVITNPGVRYEANANAIIKIYTLKEKYDGISSVVNALYEQNERPVANQSIRVNYVKKGLHLSAYYKFNDERSVSRQDAVDEVSTDTVWQYMTDRKGNPHRQTHLFSFKFDYEPVLSHVFGFQFNYRNVELNTEAKTMNDILANQVYHGQFLIVTKDREVTSNPYFNFFYNAKWNERWSSDLNLDIVSSKFNSDQNVDEITVKTKYSTRVRSSSNYLIYAGTYSVNCELADNQTIVGGIYLNDLEGDGDLRNANAVMVDLDYESSERKRATFVEYNWSNTLLSLNAGIRYEEVKSSYRDLNQEKNNVYRNYRGIFPSFSISYRGEKNNWSSSLSFSTRTQRPKLSYLNGGTHYINQFQYMVSNPQLQPQKLYIFQWLFGIKHVKFNISYRCINDYFVAVSKTREDKPNVILHTWENFREARYIQANLNVHYPVKIWTTSLTIGLTKPFLKNNYKGVVTHYNKLNYYISSNNFFTLPGDYILSVDYYFNNGGNQLINTFKHFQSLNIKLQRSFFKKQLSASVGIKDVFRGLVYYNDARIDNIRSYQREHYSSRNFFISIVYRLNKTQKTKYRGKSAASDDINRL